METSYNLAINVLKQTKMALEKEVSSLIMERDKIMQIARDQREGITIIKQEVSKKEIENYSISEQLEIISKTLNKQRDNFLNITDKEKQYLETLERSIKDKQELENKFLIKQEQVKELDTKLTEKSIEFKSLQNELGKVSQEKENTLKSIEIAILKLQEREKQIKEKEIYLNKTQIALDAREMDLSIREKRILSRKK